MNKPAVSEQINDVIDKLVDVTQPLADKLGESAEFLWEVLYREAWAIIITDFIWSMVFIAVALYGLHLGVRTYNNPVEKEYTQYGITKVGWDDQTSMKMTIATLMFIPSAIAGPVLLNRAIHGAINPAWKAIEVGLSLL